MLEEPILAPLASMHAAVRRSLLILLGLVALVATALVVLSLAGNALRGPLERYVSAKLDRPFAIRGDLRLRLWPPLGARADGIELGNPAGMDGPPLLRLERGEIRVSFLPLLGGRVEVQDATLVRPEVALFRSGEGRANWDFGGEAADAAVKAQRFPAPKIGRLQIEDGTMTYRDPKLGADLRVRMATVGGEGGGAGGSRVKVDGEGTFREEAFRLAGEAASPVSLADAEKPFPVRMALRAGKTEASFDGSFEPSAVGRIDGRVRLAGADLAELHPIVPVPMPWTPPYSFAGTLTRDEGRWTIRNLEGTMGKSDIAGVVELEEARPPKVRGELVARRLDYRDLGGLVGLPPRGKQAASNAQRAEVKRREQSPRVLPDKPFDVQALRRIDADVRFRAERFIATSLPLERLYAHAVIGAGILRARPVEFAVAGGRVEAAVEVDARAPVMRVSTDSTVRDIDLGRAFPALKPPNGRTGRLSGRAKLQAGGNSVADMLATLDGDIAMMTAGGTASALALVLSDLDLARAASFLLRGDESAEVHCVVGDFGAKQGVVALRTLVADTEVENIRGEGQVDLGNERYDVQLVAHSKQPTLALQGPIVIRGSFRKPEVMPAIGPVAARIGAAVALGVVATPIAALIPLIDPGTAKDSDCGALIGAAQGNVAASSANRAAARARNTPASGAEADVAAGSRSSARSGAQR